MIELEPPLVDPVPLLLLTLLESEGLEPETARPLVLEDSVVTLEPLRLVTLEPPKSLKTLDKLRRLELKLDVLVVPEMLDPDTLLLGLKGGLEFA